MRASRSPSTPRAPTATRSPTTPRTPTNPDDLVGLLHARGQRATPQRLVILRELRHRAHHATADEVGTAVRDTLPGTSPPTVYAALELLVELGLVRRISVGAGAALYDARAEPHQHLVCRRCGRVDDLDGEPQTAELLSAAARTGFVAQSIELVISGLCRACARLSPECARLS